MDFNGVKSIATEGRICLVDLKTGYIACAKYNQAGYNYRNLSKLMSVAPKLMNCRVNTTYFVKNYEIFLKYFNEFETQTPWKHVFSCTCEDCISYFGEPATA